MRTSRSATVCCSAQRSAAARRRRPPPRSAPQRDLFPPLPRFGGEGGKTIFSPLRDDDALAAGWLRVALLAPAVRVLDIPRNAPDRAPVHDLHDHRLDGDARQETAVEST